MERYPGGCVREGAIVWRAISLVFLLTGNAVAQQPTLVFKVPSENIVAGTPATLWLNALNDSDQPISWTFPAVVNCQLISTRTTNAAVLECQASADSMAITLAPGAFAKRPFRLALPDGL